MFSVEIPPETLRETDSVEVSCAWECPVYVAQTVLSVFASQSEKSQIVMSTSAGSGVWFRASALTKKFYMGVSVDKQPYEGALFTRCIRTVQELREV